MLSTLETIRTETGEAKDMSRTKQECEKIEEYTGLLMYKQESAYSWFIDEQFVGDRIALSYHSMTCLHVIT